MTKLLDKALVSVRRLPPVNPDEIARAMLSLLGRARVRLKISTRPTFWMCWKALRGRVAASLPRRPMLQPLSPVLIHEAALYPTCCSEYCEYRRSFLVRFRERRRE